jgi:hypothetical protein
MTREEQLKFCSVCVNKKIGPNHETICRLTNAKADFDPTCHFYQFDNNVYLPQNSSRSSPGIGKTILYFVLAVIGITRLAVSIHNSNRTSNRDEYSQFNEILRESERRREREQSRDQIGQLSQSDREELGIEKASKDSTIIIDKFIDYTLLKNEYVMTSLTDDQIRMMARDRKNFMYIIHKFDKSDHAITDWQKLRTAAGSKISPTTITYKMLDDNTFSYKVKNSFTITNGKARCFYSDKSCYIYQYESSKDQDELMIDIGFEQVVNDHIRLRK